MHKRSDQGDCAGKHRKHVAAKQMCIEAAMAQAECKLQSVLMYIMPLTCSIAEGTACSNRYCLL